MEGFIGIPRFWIVGKPVFKNLNFIMLDNHREKEIVGGKYIIVNRNWEVKRSGKKLKASNALSYF